MSQDSHSQHSHGHSHGQHNRVAQQGLALVNNNSNRMKNNPSIQNATEFYESKLNSNPNMSRYTHFMAALSTAVGDKDKADHYYRQTIITAPNDIMARNDFALHLHSLGRKEDAIHELKKANLMVDQNSVVHKNLAGLYGRQGDVRIALEHATRAKFLAPNDAMNHRNLAKLQAAMGDTHTALQHNLKSIELENPSSGIKPNTSAYRAAAVQIIARGGPKEEAHALVDAARRLDNKHVQLSTTERTNEIINKIKHQMKGHLDLMEKEKQAELQKKMLAEQEWKEFLNKITS